MPAMPDRNILYQKMYLIRRFEETLLENFARGLFSGTTHTYLGQEADGVGVISALQPDDIIFSNHRCHGHFLTYGGDPRALFAELMGRTSGVCGGRGGSQHLHWRNFYSSGIQGGLIPIATGMALAEKRRGSQAVTVVFLGDGTLGQGIIYEAFNMATLFGAPVLFVLEDNRIAQTTPTGLAVAGSMRLRFEAFGIDACELESSDVEEILPTAIEIMEKVRLQKKPQALILHTQRFGPHSKGDDTRTQAQIEQLRAEHDPLTITGRQIDVSERIALEAEVDRRIEQAFQQALSDPLPELQAMMDR